MSARDAQFEADEMAHLTELYASLDHSVIVAAYGQFKSIRTEKAWTALLAGESQILKAFILIDAFDCSLFRIGFGQGHHATGCASDQRIGRGCLTINSNINNIKCKHFERCKCNRQAKGQHRKCAAVERSAAHHSAIKGKGCTNQHGDRRLV